MGMARSGLRRRLKGEGLGYLRGRSVRLLKRYVVSFHLDILLVIYTALGVNNISVIVSIALITYTLASTGGQHNPPDLSSTHHPCRAPENKQSTTSFQRPSSSLDKPK